MPLVAGIDCSTQSCTVVVRDADSGALVRRGRAPHPDGTEVDPAAWADALDVALAAAGGWDGIAAVAVGGQQHGMVALDEQGEVVRPALLWHDTRSAAASESLIAELGGPAAWAAAVGSVPLPSFTITKLRWLAEHEPQQAARMAAVCLPHDWLTQRLRGSGDISRLTTDRGDASGTGYWADDGYRMDLLARAFGRELVVPEVLAPSAVAGEARHGAVVGPGTGDNAAAALGLQAELGDVVVSLGTSGVACAVAAAGVSDPLGEVASFADATGGFLPLVCTLNAGKVFDAVAGVLDVTLSGLSELALTAPPGCEGLSLVPYLAGERTPNRPTASGALHGLTLATTTRAHLARAAVEGVLCGLADGLDALERVGVPMGRVLLTGGAAASEAVRTIAPRILGRPVIVPAPGEHVADGAARQAAWALSGRSRPPQWDLGPTTTYEAEPDAMTRARYAEARDHVLQRS